MRCLLKLSVSPRRVSQGRRGVTLVYASVVLTIIVLMASFVVDMGRIQLAKTQLQNATDAAARYAVSGMVSSSTPQTTAQNQVLAVIKDWNIEGATLTSTNVTTTIGKWNDSSRNFVANPNNANAVKVDMLYTFNTGSGKIPLFIHAVSPSQAPSISTSAIAMATSTENTMLPPAAGNLWLSGMPAGTQSQNFRPDANWVWDVAGTSSTPQQSPLSVTLGGLSVQSGDALSFEGLSGTASYVPNSTANSADGDSSFIVALGQTYPPSVPTNSMNGMSNVRAPIGAVMAVFLDDNAPNYTSAPSALDFATASQRDYAQLAPSLKQVFFVGDGKRSTGEVQHITVPTGATRVFIGMMDAWQWNDNTGDFKFKVYGHNVIRTVK